MMLEREAAFILSFKITKEESTVLKGVSIFTVIFTHANGAQAFAGIPVLHNAVFTSLLCQGGMCIFLLLSGYGLYRSYRQKGFYSWWDRKFDKIFLPAILIQGLWYIIFLIHGYIVNGDIHVNTLTIIGDVLCVNPHNSIDGSMWYMSYLLFCYMLFYVCFRYLPGRISCGMFFFSYIIMIPISKVVWGNNFYCVSSFGIGVLWGILAEKRNLLYSMDKKIKSLGVSVAIITAVFYFYNFRKNWILDNMASNIVAIGLILAFSFWNCKKLKTLLFIGANSFILYLLEMKTIIHFLSLHYTAGIRMIWFLVLLFINVILAWCVNTVLKIYLKKE